MAQNTVGHPWSKKMELVDATITSVMKHMPSLLTSRGFA